MFDGVVLCCCVLVCVLFAVFACFVVVFVVRCVLCSVLSLRVCSFVAAVAGLCVLLLLYLLLLFVSFCRFDCVAVMLFFSGVAFVFVVLLLCWCYDVCCGVAVFVDFGGLAYAPPFFRVCV